MTDIIQVHIILENPEEQEIEFFDPMYSYHLLQLILFKWMEITEVVIFKYLSLIGEYQAILFCTKFQTWIIIQICIAIKEKVSRITSQKSSFYSLRVSTESKFNFNYGFSTDSVSSLNETHLRPIRGEQITIQNNFVVQTAKLLIILSYYNLIRERKPNLRITESRKYSSSFRSFCNHLSQWYFFGVESLIPEKKSYLTFCRNIWTPKWGILLHKGKSKHNSFYRVSINT